VVHGVIPLRGGLIFQNSLHFFTNKVLVGKSVLPEAGVCVCKCGGQMRSRVVDQRRRRCRVLCGDWATGDR